MRFVFALSLLVAGCATHADLTRQDDQTCQSYGARPGADAYVNCRAQFEAGRRTARAIIAAGD